MATSGEAAAAAAGSRPAAPEVLQVVPLYLGGAAGLLADLEARLQRELGLAVERHTPSFDPDLAFEATRGQYNSRILLALLLRDLRPHCSRVLGVAGVDLFVPVLTFVFGEAQLAGRAAVVSLHRLGPELYGLPPDPALLRERLAKEAIHELGHTYGLLHCRRGRCVMASSTYVEYVDLKSHRLCDSCRGEMAARRRGIAPGAG
jgi:archaemetzincin